MMQLAAQGLSITADDLYLNIFAAAACVPRLVGCDGPGFRGNSWNFELKKVIYQGLGDPRCLESMVQLANEGKIL